MFRDLDAPFGAGAGAARGTETCKSPLWPPAPAGPGRIADLPADRQWLLWALRSMAHGNAVAGVRCRAAHIVLQREFGEAAPGIEHLLRCWLVGLARRLPRSLALGAPCCPMLTADEAGLLAVLDTACAEPATAARLLAQLGLALPPLLPLFAAVAMLAENRR